jgi:hypothetical protein
LLWAGKRGSRFQGPPKLAVGLAKAMILLRIWYK